MKVDKVDVERKIKTHLINVEKTKKKREKAKSEKEQRQQKGQGRESNRRD